MVAAAPVPAAVVAAVALRLLGLLLLLCLMQLLLPWLLLLLLRLLLRLHLFILSDSAYFNNHWDFYLLKYYLEVEISREKLLSRVSVLHLRLISLWPCYFITRKGKRLFYRYQWFLYSEPCLM